MNTNTSRWKKLSSVALFGLLSGACGDTSAQPGVDLVVRGTVEGALSAEAVLEVTALWGHNSNNELVGSVSTAVNEDGDFRIALPASPPPEALITLEGGALAASASIVLTVDDDFHAQSMQTLIFVSEDTDFNEISPDSKLGRLTAGYHLAQANGDGEPEIIPFDTTVIIDVNSRENCNFRLYPELTSCEEQAADSTDEVFDACFDAHTARVEACAAAG